MAVGLRGPMISERRSPWEQLLGQQEESAGVRSQGQGQGPESLLALSPLSQEIGGQHQTNSRGTQCLGPPQGTATPESSVKPSSFPQVRSN